MSLADRTATTCFAAFWPLDAGNGFFISACQSAGKIELMLFVQDPVDPLPYASFLMQRLLREGRVGDAEPLKVVVETEWPTDGDTWAWTDDNAKVLELLSHPAIWHHYRAEALDILKFLRHMSDGPFIFRRLAAPRLEQIGGNDKVGNYLHSLMHINSDLNAGILMAGLRFHDGRTASNLFLTGNYVQFCFHGQFFTIDVEEGISKTHSKLQDGHLILSHITELSFQHLSEVLRLGQLTYKYHIYSHSMLIQIEVTLELDDRVDVDDVILTIGHDNLSHGDINVHYSRIGTILHDNTINWFSTQNSSQNVIPAAGGQFYSIIQNEMHGFALGIHSLCRTPEKLKELRVVSRQHGHLHWVVAAYQFPGRHRGGRLTVAEDKLLTGGGFYAEVPSYAQLIRKARLASSASWAQDLSISYDYGVEINAYAKLYAVHTASTNRSEYGLRSELRDLTNYYLDTYQMQFLKSFGRGESAVFSRQIAFVMMAAATMLRATGDARYRKQLADLCNVLLEFEVPISGRGSYPESGFLMGLRSSRDIHVDCHSAALLALTHAAPWLEDSRIVVAIDRGLEAYSLVTGTIDWIGTLRKIDSAGLMWRNDDGQERLSHSFWNYQAGLTLRLFRALRSAQSKDLAAVYHRHSERIETIETLLLHQVARATRKRGEGLEVRTSFLSSETNSETQPWVTLGLVGHVWD